MRNDDKSNSPPRPNLGNRDQEKDDIRTTAMGLPKTAHHSTGPDDEGWQMVPLSALDPLPEFKSTNTPSSARFIESEPEFEGESTDISRRIQKRKISNIDVDLNPIGLAPTKKSVVDPIERSRNIVSKAGSTQKPSMQQPLNAALDARIQDPLLDEFDAAFTEISEASSNEEVAKLKVLRGPNIDEERFLNGPYMSIGRATENTFMTLDLAMSRSHFFIERRNDGAYWVQDNQSANGTYLNGERLRAPVLLVPGDRIEAGESEIEFVDKWRPIHDSRGRFGAQPIARPEPNFRTEEASSQSKFGLAWLFAILSFIVAAGALVFAIVAPPKVFGGDPAETAYLAATEARRDLDWETAQKKYREAKGLNPDLPGIDDELLIIDRELQASRALETAKALIERERYETAIGELVKVPDDSVYNAQAKTLMKEATALKAEEPNLEEMAEEPSEEVPAKTEESETDDEEMAFDLGAPGNEDPKPLPEEDEPVVEKKGAIKLLGKPKEDEDDEEGFDLDLGETKKKSTPKPAEKKPVRTKKKKKKSAKKKTKKKKKSTEEDDGLSIW